MTGEGPGPKGSPVTYLRLYTDDEAESHFVSRSMGGVVEAEAAGRTLIDGARASGYSLRVVPPGWTRDWGPSKARTLAVYIAGEGPVESSDGDRRRVCPGVVLLAEDTTGRGHRAEVTGDDLARFADGEWTRWSSADLPDVSPGLDYEFEVAPDGSLWFSLWRGADGEPLGGDWWLAVRDGHLVRDGLARFDGDAVDRFLAGRCISMDIAADGSVWVLSDDDRNVITSEAVAAGE